MTQYRGFIIEPHFIYHDPFTKIPTGKIDGIIYRRDDEESAQGFYRETLREVKETIDAEIAEGTHYRVVNRQTGTITKFFWLSDAITFCQVVKIDLGSIRLFIKGEEKHFDSI